MKDRKFPKMSIMRYAGTNIAGQRSMRASCRKPCDCILLVMPWYLFLQDCGPPIPMLAVRFRSSHVCLFPHGFLNQNTFDVGPCPAIGLVLRCKLWWLKSVHHHKSKRNGSEGRGLKRMESSPGPLWGLPWCWLRCSCYGFIPGITGSFISNRPDHRFL